MTEDTTPVGIFYDEHGNVTICPPAATSFAEPVEITESEETS